MTKFEKEELIWNGLIEMLILRLCFIILSLSFYSNNI